MYDILLQKGKSLCRLERGSRRIGSHYGTVQQRFLPVFLKQVMVLPTLASNHQAGIKSGRRDHAQDVSRSRLYGHNRTYLVLQQTFAQHLQFYIKP